MILNIFWKCCKMAKNAQNDPILIDQTLKTPYFLITNVIWPIQVQKSGKKIPPLQNPLNKLLCSQCPSMSLYVSLCLLISVNACQCLCQNSRKKNSQCLSMFLIVFDCPWLSSNVSHHPSLSLIVLHCLLLCPHCLLLSHIFTHCYSLSFIVSHCLSLSLIVSHCIS